MLSILLSTEFYAGRDDLMIDEIITFFVAGMKTIQISSTNLIYYLTKYKDIRHTLLSEIRPAVDKVKANIVEGLTYETVMEFQYLFQCYYESLRIEPPLT